MTDYAYFQEGATHVETLEGAHVEGLETLQDSVFDKFKSGFYTDLKLRWDDYAGMIAIVILPSMYFVYTGEVWPLPLIAIFGYLWATRAGSTDWEASLEYGDQFTSEDLD